MFKDISRTLTTVARDVFLHLMLDHTVWARRGHSPVVDSLMTKIEGKLKITKGEKLVMSCDVRCLILRVCLLPHKAQEQQGF